MAVNFYLNPIVQYVLFDARLNNPRVIWTAVDLISESGRWSGRLIDLVGYEFTLKRRARGSCIGIQVYENTVV